MNVMMRTHRSMRIKKGTTARVTVVRGLAMMGSSKQQEMDGAETVRMSSAQGREFH